MNIRSILHKIFALGLSTLLISTAIRAQSSGAPGVDYSKSRSLFPNFSIYRSTDTPPANLDDSPRLDRMIRGAKLYLSLQDAIALAIENNLDIASARYGSLEADTDILRARAGAQLSGVQTQISTLSTGQSASPAGAAGGGARGQASGVTQSASNTAQGLGGAGSTGNAASFFGTQVTNLDPNFSASMSWLRQSNPQITQVVTGTNTLVQDISFYNYGFSQGFTTGTSVNLGFTTVTQDTTSRFNNFNPTLTSDLSLSVRQRLTQGFGRSVNNRNIRVAKNNREIQDLQFEQQVVTTVSRLQNLYWDLVAFLQEAEARRLDVSLAEKLVSDTTKQVEFGMQARVEIIRSQAEATSFRQQLVQAQTDVAQQMEILKNAITKHGPTSATLADVEIVPTDRIVVPAVEPIEPLQDLVQRAIQSRPDVAQSRMNLTNSDIQMKGVRNAMLPSVDIVGFATNNALAGRINQNLIPSPGVGQPDQFFIGGLGTALSQIASRNFPDYGVQLQLNVPLKNRQAQADLSREMLRRRRQDISHRQLENAVKLEVSRALSSRNQARENYEVAVEARQLREQMVEAEGKRFELGSSTIFQVIQAQRDLSAARTNEINALRNYQNSKVEMDRVTDRTLQANHVSIDEAYNGRSSKEPDPPPPGP